MGNAQKAESLTAVNAPKLSVEELQTMLQKLSPYKVNEFKKFRTNLQTEYELGYYSEGEISAKVVQYANGRMKSYKLLHSPGKQRSMRLVTSSPSKTPQSISPSRTAAVDIVISSKEKTKPKPAFSFPPVADIVPEVPDDSDEEFDPEYYCAICRQEFSSQAQLSRHMQYSSVHASRLASDAELAKAVYRSLEVWNTANDFIATLEGNRHGKKTICVKNANAAASLDPSQNRYRLLWKTVIRKAMVEVSVRKLNERIMGSLTDSRLSTGPVLLLLRHTKIFWKHRLNVTIFVYLHEVKHPTSLYSQVIEIVSHDNHGYAEISRIYCDYKALLTHIKPDIDTRIMRKTYELLRCSKEAVVITPAVHLEVANEACADFLMARLCVDAGARTALETLAICFLPTDSLYIREALIVCRWKAAKILKPANVSPLLPPRPIPSAVIVSATTSLELSTKELSCSTRVAGRLSENVEQTLQQLFDEHRMQSEAALARGVAESRYSSLWRKAAVHEIAASMTSNFRQLIGFTDNTDKPKSARPDARKAAKKNAAKPQKGGGGFKKQAVAVKKVVAAPT